MHINMLLQHQTLRVTVQSSTESPGADVIYQIRPHSRAFQRLSNYLSTDTHLTVDSIRWLHQQAMNSASGVSVSYPKLAKFEAQIRLIGDKHESV